MTQNQLNKLMQLRAKMELMFVDFQEFAQQVQAEFQEEQIKKQAQEQERKKAEVVQKVAENMKSEEKKEK